jgi:hypothetical protein
VLASDCRRRTSVAKTSGEDAAHHREWQKNFPGVTSSLAVAAAAAAVDNINDIGGRALRRVETFRFPSFFGRHHRSKSSNRDDGERCQSDRRSAGQIHEISSSFLVDEAAAAAAASAVAVAKDGSSLTKNGESVTSRNVARVARHQEIARRICRGARADGSTSV